MGQRSFDYMQTRLKHEKKITAAETKFMRRKSLLIPPITNLDIIKELSSQPIMEFIKKLRTS
jgi:hypothetical protein